MNKIKMQNTISIILVIVCMMGFSLFQVLLTERIALFLDGLIISSDDIIRCLILGVGILVFQLVYSIQMPRSLEMIAERKKEKALSLLLKKKGVSSLENSDLFSITNNIDQVVELLEGEISWLSRVMGKAIVAFIVCFNRCKRLMIPLILIPIYVITLEVNEKRSKQHYRVVVEERNKKTSFSIGLIQSKMSIVLNRLQERAYGGYKAITEKEKEEREKEVLHISTGKALYGFVQIIQLLVYTIIGSDMINKRMMSGGEIIAFYTISLNIWYMAEIYSLLQSRIRRLIALNKNIETMISNIEAYSDLGSNLLPSIKKVDCVDIYIDKLVCRNKNSVLLEKSSMRLKKGKVNVLCGENGCGKSTLLKALVGIACNEPIKIVVNSKDYYTQNNNIWRGSVAYSSQDPYIFKGTLIENVCFGKPNQEDCYKITNLLSGLDVNNDKTSANRSQETIDPLFLLPKDKQIICIARAFVSNRPVVFLDESLSYCEDVDKMMGIIKKLAANKVLLIVSHDKNVIRKADVVYSIENGCIREHEASDEKHYMAVEEDDCKN